MFNRRSLLSVLFGLLVCGAAVPASAQEIIVDGPPPALRKNLDAFQTAFSSGNADQYEAMIQTSFTPEYVKKQTPAQRKADYLKWFAQYGKIRFQRVERNGMDAPLEISVNGSVGSGAMWIEVDDASSKLMSLRVEPVKKDTSGPNADRRD